MKMAMMTVNDPTVQGVWLAVTQLLQGSWRNFVKFVMSPSAILTTHTGQYVGNATTWSKCWGGTERLNNLL